MKIDQNLLIDEITQTNSLIYGIVGVNGCGKTYFLNKLLGKTDIRALFINEEGLSKSNVEKNKVTAIDNMYYYRDDSTRGSVSKLPEQEIQNEFTIKILTYINKLKASTKTKNTSKGIIKFNSILDTLTSYNLNNIDYIIFDEPENFLDDINLLNSAKIIKLLLENNKKVIFATHSSRFLEILNINIEQIVLLDKKDRKFIITNLTDICDLYKKVSDEILSFCNKKYEENIDIHLKLFMPEEIFETYIKDLMNTQEWYRSLFYEDVFLAEGHTEQLIFAKVSDKSYVAKNLFITHGKALAPFLIKLFTLFNKNIYCMIDSDRKENNRNYTVGITDYLEQEKRNNKNLTLIINSPDIESEFPIDENLLAKFQNDVQGKRKVEKLKRGFFKPYIFYISFLLKDDNIKLFQKKISTNDDFYNWNS